MGSSKGGGAGQSDDYYGTIAGIVCIGPVQRIEAILIDGKQVYGADEGPLVYGDPGVGDGYSLTIPDHGRMDIWWGTETQGIDNVLNAQAPNQHPAYRGWFKVTLVDFLFGTESDSPPSIEFIFSAAPAQEVVDSYPASLDGDSQANLVAIGAELLTAWHGLALPVAAVDAESLQAVADDLATDDGRALAACSPVWTDATAARSMLADLGALAEVWWRHGPDGRVQAGRWLRAAPMTGLTVIDGTVWVSPPKDDAGDLDDIPTGWDVSYKDRDQLFVQTSELVVDLAALQLGVQPKRQSVSRDMVTSGRQARRQGAEAMRLQGNPIVRGSVDVRRTQAVNPDASPILPGDYFLLDVDAEPGGEGLAALARCTGRSFGPEGPVTLDYELDPLAAPEPYSPAWSDAPPGTDAVPPLLYQRTLALPPQPGVAPGIHILALRHRADMLGVGVYFDSDSAGNFTRIGYQPGFALPLQLMAAVSDADTTLHVGLLDGFGAGGAEPADIDAYLIREAVGVTGPAAAEANELLLVLVKKDPETGDVIPWNDVHWVEICSVQEVAQVEDGWDVDVLRARLGTPPLAFDDEGGATSFPDGFVRYEAWVVTRSRLETLRHPDFIELLRAGAQGFFRFEPRTRRNVYDPAIAHAAGFQDDDGWTPTWAYTWPQGYDTMPGVSIATPDAGASADSAGVITLTFEATDAQSDLVSVVVTSQAISDDSGYTEHLRRSMPKTGDFAFSESITLPAIEGWHRVLVRVTDALANIAEASVDIYRPGEATLLPPSITPPSGGYGTLLSVTISKPSGSPGGSQLEYRINGGDWVVLDSATNSVTLSPGFNSTVEAAVLDGTVSSAITTQEYWWSGKDDGGSGRYLP